MSVDEKDDLISIGELASMFNMSKQTLNYYSKTGILPPEQVNDSGYRCYSKKQFTDLEKILILRKLNIPLNDIRDFINKREAYSVVSLLEKKLNASMVQLEREKQLIASLQKTLNSLKGQEEMVIDCFQTQLLPELAVKICYPLSKSPSQHTFPEYIRHNQRMFSSVDFCSLTSGWIIDKEEYLIGNTLRIKAYYSPLSKNTGRKDVFVIPGGLYVTLHFRGSHYRRREELRERLLEYVSRNSLRIIGDTYIRPLKNHWQTDNIDEYIGKLAVRVEYQP